MIRFYSIAALAQQVERIHGKDEVLGSIPGSGSNLEAWGLFFIYIIKMWVNNNIY